MKPFVYVAGAYTDAVDIADAMLADGVVTPLVPPHGIESDLELHTRWLAEVLGRCDALYRLSGESDAIDSAIAFAGEHLIPVFKTLFGLYIWSLGNWSKKESYD